MQKRVTGASSASSIGMGMLVLLLLFAVLQASLSSVGSVKRLKRAITQAGDDDISAYDRRYRELREALPPGTKVGYVSDLSLINFDPNEAVALLNFQLARYVLAPVVVSRAPDCCELVVGNFIHSDEIHADFGELALTVVEDFGDGVVLYQREAQ